MPLHRCTLHGGRCCAPAEGAARVGGGGPGRRRRQLTIDLHCHALTVAVEKLVAGRPEKLAEPALQRRMQGEASTDYNNATMLPNAGPKLTSLELRLRDMDAMGVDVQVVSPSPSQYYYWADPDLADQIVRAHNEDIASICARHPERFRGLGNLALQHPDLAVRQLEHAVRTLGFKGIEVSTLVNGAELADPRFAPVWARAEELGALVFIHPLGTSVGERLNRYYLSNVIGQPIETTIALSQLIFGGVLDRHPGLKIVAAHGGGYLPSYIGRSDHAWRERSDSHAMARAPSEYLKQIWFDDLVYTPEGLRHLVNEVGVSQVVVGTDYPFDMGAYDVHGLVEAVPGLSDADKDAILGGNALRLLG